MSAKKFKPVSPQVNFPQLEEKILKYWRDNKIFEKSLAKNPKSNTWTFLDGPPFITGLPHYGSLLSSIPKDIFPRYKTMNSYYVRRVWGWDCHGLPAENKVEEKLGITRKKDIEEKIGIKKFIDECKLYVNQVSGEWEWYVDHVGRWVDFKNAYRTMDLPYMETAMWVFKQMYDKGFIYKGLRVSLFCPHCSTPISNFEVAMDADNYKEITEPSNTYKYQLIDEKDTYFLAWSTTPWNKIVTPALAVNTNIDYVKVKQGKENYILAASTLKILKDEPYKIIAKFKGADLVGKKFIPHYDFYKIEAGKKAFIIVGADFVTAQEGTGIVTIAAYGEEDLALMQKENIQIVLHVDDEGIIKKDVPKWAGMYYLKVNKLVNEDLDKRGLLYKEENSTHTVPTCWRCHTRLFYAPQNAWYVNVQSLKAKLKETNESVNWFPAHFKYGRYLKSLENAPDWCISRSRYWGSPVPVWECTKCDEKIVPGSVNELEKLSGKKINDLHKPEIDEVIIKCPKCKGNAERVPEVLDSWIEAGSAPFAERHFPFEKNLRLNDFFPPDFITEYTGQIRAWFYVLHVIATAIYGKQAFKNVLVTGVILGTDGRKMSKNYGNYPDPKELIQKYGGDALRLYLMGSPVANGEDILISEESYRQQVKGLMLIYWNIYNFFITYANIDGWEPNKNFSKSTNLLDEWILSRLSGNIDNITKNGYEKYDTQEITGNFAILMRDLSLLYIRRQRDRVGPTVDNTDDKNWAHQTLWTVLTEYTKVLAPLIPFITEEIYTNLTGEESVHLNSWPNTEHLAKNNELEKEIDDVINLSSAIHAARKLDNLKVRTPVKEIHYKGPREIKNSTKKLVLDEVNAYEIIYDGNNGNENYSATIKNVADNLDLKRGEARDIIRQIQNARKEAGCELDQFVAVKLPAWPKEFENEIKKQTLTKELIKSDKLEIVK
ncbi:MAG: isoleucine--tRNA ligase [Patescibacteria group bacterium]